MVYIYHYIIVLYTNYDYMCISISSSNSDKSPCKPSDHTIMATPKLSWKSMLRFYLFRGLL